MGIGRTFLIVSVLFVLGCSDSNSIGSRWTKEYGQTRCGRAATNAEVAEILVAFDKIEIGMSRQEAERILGKPNGPSIPGNLIRYLPSPPIELWQSPWGSDGVYIKYKNNKVIRKVLNPQFKRPQPENPETEALIDKLPGVSEIGYGYSATFSGSHFLPHSDSYQVHTLVLGSQPPMKSSTLDKIVRQGFTAVPLLLKNLDDSRKTKVPPLKGKMWISFADEYDFNQRTRKEVPEGVNKDMLGMFGKEHTITVGDLCFVALGQILNRSFNATRYQPTGGLIVNSPTYSKRLCSVVRKDWQDLTEQKHRKLLAQDFLTPDHEDRRIGAYRRLAFYYPDDVESLVLKQLGIPTFDVSKVDSFIRETLYSLKSKAKQKELFQRFVSRNGPASSDGILLQLFGDLDTQEADEQGRSHPPRKDKYDARNLLILLYGYPKDVKSDQAPFADTWATSEQARFIKALVHDSSKKIDKAVYNIFQKIKDDDYLALACMNRLIDRGYGDEVKAYCKKRIGKDKYHTRELETMLANLEEKGKNTQQGASAGADKPRR
ncbi:MAG: hypothetical protein K8S55_02515 [Phycisphaerae bacterium]|nr:hypothetical protein [Phycisphaerae bacterium]